MEKVEENLKLSNVRCSELQKQCLTVETELKEKVSNVVGRFKKSGMNIPRSFMLTE